MLLMFVVEGIFRWAEYDFARGQEETYTAYPIFYRQPRVPLGDIFFRRTGPDSWTGNVLRSAYVLQGGTDDTFTDVPSVTITYDSEGLRNPVGLSDWDVVVVGDSFVELGHLAYRDLFTTQLANLLGWSVKNVGVSYSGPSTYVAYLEHFGLAPGTRHALMVFFEGNDLVDLEREIQARRRYTATGQREERAITPQTSFLRALYHFFRQQVQPPETRAFFGEEQVTLHYRPPFRVELSDHVQDALNSTLKDWATVATTHTVRPWLVYMPCKRRVLDGYVRGNIPAWEPSDLPVYMEELAAKHDIAFIDLTPAMRREAARGKLTYNGEWDTHLNSYGASIVAQVLAQAIEQ